MGICQEFASAKSEVKLTKFTIFIETEHITLAVLIAILAMEAAAKEPTELFTKNTGLC